MPLCRRFAGATFGRTLQPPPTFPRAQTTFNIGDQLEAVDARHWCIVGTNVRAYSSDGPIVSIVKFHNLSKVHVQCDKTFVNGMVDLSRIAYKRLN